MKAAMLSIALAACHPVPASPPVSNRAPAAVPGATAGAEAAARPVAEPAEPPDAATGAVLDAGAAGTVARLEQFADAMCQCTDRDCAERVVDDMARWAQELAAAGQAMPKVTSAEDAQAHAATDRMAQCMAAVYKHRAGSLAP